MLQFVFWISLAIIFYVYLGYPLLAHLFGKKWPLLVRKQAQEPYVSILIAAYNEADVIQATVLNKLQLNYPADKYEIIVISDQSEDGTDAIVTSFSETNVRLLRQEPRAGKTSALNMAIPEAKGEIIVFSDANSLYDPDALRKLVANFADPQVGYVTGKMIYVDADGSMVGDGCSSYMYYENFLRAAETRLGSVVGVDGGVDAVRKELYRPMRADQLPDFVLPLSVVEQGYRVVYEPEALLRETTLKDPADEYRMRVRVSLRALWALWDMRKLLGGQINSRFAWQLWSHKVLRYLCFVFLISAFVSNVFLLKSGDIYRLLLLLQVLCYAGALLMPWVENQGYRYSLLNFLRYFLLLNVASAHAFVKFLSGKKQALWTPRKG
jgi:cellulose synthase/poly-beta-1,6-N-acetylglucosamine synthase-like glycosyltransferase